MEGLNFVEHISNDDYGHCNYCDIVHLNNDYGHCNYCDIVHLNNGAVLVINDEGIGLYTSEEAFNDGKGHIDTILAPKDWKPAYRDFRDVPF